LPKYGMDRDLLFDGEYRGGAVGLSMVKRPGRIALLSVGTSPFQDGDCPDGNDQALMHRREMA
jgi:hypothetical protein